MKTYKNLPFTEKIETRNRFLWAVLVLMLIYMVVVGLLGLGDSRIMSRLAMLTSRVIFFGGMIYIFCKIRRNKKLLDNPMLMKEQFLQEKDEMNRLIYDKSGGVVWDILLICQLFITLTTSLMNMAAFYSAFVTLSILVAGKVIAYLYLRKNMI